MGGKKTWFWKVLESHGFTTTADSRRNRREAKRAIEKNYERRLREETKRREENMEKFLKDLQKDKRKEIEGENLLRL